MKIGLIGNQNSGKTTLFNRLTGLNQKVGNWAGVTIDKKSGEIRGTEYELVDTPGVYSLCTYTLEEKVTSEYIKSSDCDIILNIIDATSIERGLYLTTQLMELGKSLIVALNMSDIAKKRGTQIDCEKLSESLGVKVVEISAFRNTGIEYLIDIIKNVANELSLSSEQNAIVVKNDFDSSSEKLDDMTVIDSNPDNSSSIEEKACVCEHCNNCDKNKEGKKRKSKTPCDKNKYKENQSIENQVVESQNSENSCIENQAVENQSNGNVYVENQNSENETNELTDTNSDTSQTKAEVDAANRYSFIEKIIEKSVKTVKVKTATEKIDRIVLNKWLALPIFAVIMFLIYFLSVGVVGSLTVGAVGGLIGNIKDSLSSWLLSIGASEWSVSLLCGGIISGVGAVLNFIPQLIILFLLITLLETTGYMARIAFTFDMLFKKLGLSGKSLIPFIIGTGCSVPAIMSTRTIEDKSERMRTVILTPFIPCSAKLPIIALFSSFFFGKYSGLVSVSLYFFSIIVIIISALLMKKFVFKRDSSTFISELPDYKIPSFTYVLKEVGDKVLSFIKKAGTIILLASVIIWLLLSFSIKFEYGVEIENSILAFIGKGISWIFYPMLGTNSWEAAVSAIQGLVAKEQVISSMAIIAGLSGDSTEFLASSVFSFFTGASAYAYMVFNLFSAPCLGAIGAMKKELGSTKKMLLAVAFQTVLALLLSYLVFFIGSLFAL